MPFTLVSGHESIHLCNNAVQTKYANAERSSKLPPDNMWDNKVSFLDKDKYLNLVLDHKSFNMKLKLFSIHML